MIDTLCILLSLVSVVWVLVRAAMMDPLRPWIERLQPQRRRGRAAGPQEGAPWAPRP